MKNNRITLVNEIPELLQAVCEHPRCPEWLKFDIWDAFADHNTTMSFKADHWRAVLNQEDIDFEAKREIGMCQYPHCDREMETLRYCFEHAERIMDRDRQRLFERRGEQEIQGGLQ